MRWPRRIAARDSSRVVMLASVPWLRSTPGLLDATQNQAGGRAIPADHVIRAPSLQPCRARLDRGPHEDMLLVPTEWGPKTRIWLAFLLPWLAVLDTTRFRVFACRVK